MYSLLRITGPNVTREVALDPSGVEVSLGRDPAADVCLPDPEKSISRKHIAIRQGQGAVEMRVVSSVNGVETSRGTIQPGQAFSLAIGDHFTLGPYRVNVVSGTESTPVSPTAASAGPPDDLFSALLGGAGTPRRGADPFDRSEFRGRPRTAGGKSNDPFTALSGATNQGNARNNGPFGDLLGPGTQGSQNAPRLPTDSSGRDDGRAGGQNLDDWLADVPGTSLLGNSTAGPLDSFLGRKPSTPSRAISPDHVHDFHMPVQLTPPVSSAPAVTSNASAAPSNDIWSGLLDGWGQPKTPSPPGASAQPDVSGQGNTPLPPNPFDDIDISVGDEAFGSWTGTVPVPQHQPEPQIPRLASAQSEPGTPAPHPSGDASEPMAKDGVGTAWTAFARGLGLPENQGSDDKAAERAGAMVRLLVEGLAALLSARAELKRELRAEDRTMMSGKDNNPLKLNLSAVDLVQYLFASQAAGGYMPAERAVKESIAELGVHEHATIFATRSAVEGALRDFEPGRIRKQLMKGKPGMFQVLDNAKLWEAYQQHYEKQSQHMADWLESIFNRHFMLAYARETERLKSEAPDSPAD